MRITKLFAAVAALWLGASAAAAQNQPPVAPPAAVPAGSISISASNVSAATALPNAALAAYNVLTLYNTGTKDVFFATGGSTVAATTSPILPNTGMVPAGIAIVVWTSGSYIATVTGGSDTTTLRVFQGNGGMQLSKPAGGGGGGTANLVVGTSTITGATDGNILRNNAGVLDQYGISGTGSVCMTTSCTMVTPTLGVASATSVAITPGANATPITVTGSSITGSSTVRPGVSIAGTLNTSGVVDGAALFANITNTASGAGTLLADLQVGASSKFSVDMSGNVVSAGSLTLLNTGQLAFVNRSILKSPADSQFSFNNNAASQTSILTIPANATFQFGATDAASPVAQTLGVQSVVAGTSNTAGVNTTLKASAGTGTGVGGSLVFQTAPAGSTGTAQNAFVTALTLDSSQNATFGGTVAINSTVSNTPLTVFSPNVTAAATVSLQMGKASSSNNSAMFTFNYNGNGSSTNALSITFAGAAFNPLTVTAAGNVTVNNNLTSGGVSFHADGAVGTPSVAFTNETNTGLYRVGANTLGIAVGGVLKADYGLSTASQWTVGSSLTVQGGLTLQAAGLLSFSGRGSFTSPAAGQIQMGFDNTSPVAQTLSMGSYPTGSANGAGANGTLQASLSTGTGLAGTYQINTGFQSLSENAAVTITNASPAVVTYTAHGLVPGASGQFTTTGTLPTGLSLATTYYVCATGIAANTFQVSASWTSGACGTIINTSSAGSGTHTFTTNTTVQNAPSALAVFGPSGLTGSQATSALSLTQTWNTSGTPTALKLNVTNIASNAASLLMDLQVGGASVFAVNQAGVITTTNNINTLNLTLSGTTGLAFSSLSAAIQLRNFATTITSPAAATLQLGNLDAASPVAQTLQAQSVVAGTSNTAGANLTIGGSKSTGTGAGGSIIFQTSPAGSTGTSQNALATALTIDSTKLATFANGITVSAGALSVATGNLSMGSAQVMGWSSRSNFTSPADGQITLFNTSLNGFTRLNFGGTTTSFPSLKINGAILQTRLADDSAYAAFEGSTLRTATAFTVSTLPAAGTQGRRAYVTDQLTTCAGVGVAPTGGGAKVCPVFDDGTSWVGG